MNIPDDLEKGEIGMDGIGLKHGIMWKLPNKTDPGFSQGCVGDCDKV